MLKTTILWSILGNRCPRLKYERFASRYSVLWLVESNPVSHRFLINMEINRHNPLFLLGHKLQQKISRVKATRPLINLS